MSSTENAGFVLDALEQTIHLCRRAQNKLAHHLDRGSENLSIKYTERLAEAKIAPSIGSVGESYDNALQKRSMACPKPRSRAQPQLDFGFLEVENYAAERAVRPVGVGCINNAFMGLEAGGKSAAVAHTLIETATMNTVDPEAWLAWLFERIQHQPANRRGWIPLRTRKHPTLHHLHLGTLYIPA